MKWVLFAFVSILLYSCKESINDKNKRNENWFWYVPEGETDGKWYRTGQVGEILDGKFTSFFCNGRLAQKSIIHNKKNAIRLIDMT